MLKNKLTDTLVNSNLSKNKKQSHIQPIIVTTSCTGNISGITSKTQKLRSNSESDKVSLSLSSGERLDTASSSKNSSNHSLRGQPLSFEETTSAVAPASAALASATEGSNTSISKITTTAIALSCNHPNNRIDSTIQMLEEIIDPIAEEDDDEIDIDNTDEDITCDLASSVPIKISIGNSKQRNSNSCTPSTSTGLTALKLNVKSKTANDNKKSKMNASKSLNDNSVIVNLPKTRDKSTVKAPSSEDKRRSNLLLGRKCLKVMPSKSPAVDVASPTTPTAAKSIVDAELKTNQEPESSNTSGNENSKKESGKLGYNNLIASLLRTTTL